MVFNPSPQGSDETAPAASRRLQPTAAQAQETRVGAASRDSGAPPLCGRSRSQQKRQEIAKIIIIITKNNDNRIARAAPRDSLVEASAPGK